jgi:hypothetical protein
MNSIGPLIFLSLAFGFTLAIRVIILIVLRSGETTKAHRTDGKQPTVIPSDLFSASHSTKQDTKQ